MEPFSTLVNPAKAWINSVCPLPSIPAIPTTSPARTSKLRFFTASKPRLSFTTKSLIDKIVSFGCAGFFSVLKETERPTIISANCCEETSFTLTVPILCPRRMTVQRSATFLISSNLCVIKMIDLPSSVSSFKIIINSSISCGVNTAVGSSKIKTFAPRYKVFKISTRCCIPTEISRI